MQVVDTGTLPWLGALPHRPGGIEFKSVFAGQDGADDNYLLSLVLVHDHYFTPPHRHNFDQVRLILEGEFGFGDQTQTAGQVGYFPEGIQYTQKGDGRSVTLLLQAANASRSRYLSRAELETATDVLRHSGSFANGHYVRSSPSGLMRQDGYEAAWEHITGQRMVYQMPRYNRPIIMEPERFAFVPLTGQDGVGLKRLGTFTERELEIAIASVPAGATWWLAGARMGRALFYVLKGEGAVGNEAYQQGSALRLNSDDSARLTARSDSEIFFIGLPK